VRRRVRRGFNLVELLIALSISATLLTAVMVALDASFVAYQRTTEQASTQTIGRLTMHRMLTLIRSGEDFGPFPLDPLDRIVESDFIEIRLVEGGDVVTLEWREGDEALYYIVGGDEHLLLEGVIAATDPDTGDPIPPFTLEYEMGRKLYRATIDLSLRPDDNMDVQLDGDWEQIIRLVASAQPRGTTFNAE
jgi:prepilin-type N-terminal cleavage/methylation domain-containing protein